MVSSIRDLCPGRPCSRAPLRSRSPEGHVGGVCCGNRPRFHHHLVSCLVYASVVGGGVPISIRTPVQPTWLPCLVYSHGAGGVQFGLDLNCTRRRQPRQCE